MKNDVTNNKKYRSNNNAIIKARTTLELNGEKGRNPTAAKAKPRKLITLFPWKIFYSSIL